MKELIVDPVGGSQHWHHSREEIQGFLSGKFAQGL